MQTEEAEDQIRRKERKEINVKQLWGITRSSLTPLQEGASSSLLQANAQTPPATTLAKTSLLLETARCSPSSRHRRRCSQASSIIQLHSP